MAGMNSLFPATLKLPLQFDAQRLQQDVEQFAAHEWQAHFNRSVYEGDWSGIALRACPDAAVPLFPDPNNPQPFCDTPALARLRYVPSVLACIESEIRSARLLKLAPGANIRRHRDYQLSPEEGEVRLHIPVQTAPEVEFTLDDQRIPMAEGELWFLNFNLYHSVQNRSTRDRIHLVVDCVFNPWLRSFFEPGFFEPGFFEAGFFEAGANA